MEQKIVEIDSYELSYSDIDVLLTFTFSHSLNDLSNLT